MSEQHLDESTDPEILAVIGRRLARLRTSAGLQQEEVARLAGLNRMTVSRAERGENPTLLTVVRLLRVYGRLSALGSFIPEAEVSPIALVRSRKRRSGG